MGIRIKQYKNGDYRVWSSTCDGWLTKRLTEQETIEYLTKRIQEKADSEIRELRATFPFEYPDIDGNMIWNEQLSQKFIDFRLEENKRILGNK